MRKLEYTYKYEECVLRYAELKSQITFMEKHRQFRTRYYTERKEEFEKELDKLEDSAQYYLNKLEELINKEEPV